MQFNFASEANTAPMKARDRLILAAIVIVAVVLRLPSLLHDGFYRDEAYVYFDVTAPSFAQFMHRVTEVEWHPPLYFVLAYLYTKVVGASEFSLKFLPFIFSILTVPIVYWLGKIVGSVTVGLLAAAFYAVSPTAILYSTYYLYPLMGLLCVLLACLVASARHAPLTPLRFVEIACAAFLVVFTHYFALVYVPLLIVWALTSPRGIKRGVAVSGALVVGLATFVFWVPVFLHQRHVGLPYVAHPAALDRAAFFGVALLQFVPVRPLAITIAFALLIAAMLCMVARDRALNADAVALELIFLGALLFAAIEGLRVLHYIVPFYGLACVFFAWVTASALRDLASTLVSGSRRVAIAGLGIVAALLFVGDVVDVAAANENPASGMRSFAAAKPVDPSTYYLIAPDYLAASFAFYVRPPAITYGAFAQHDRPEIYRLENQVDVWNNPDAVADEMQRLAREARTYRNLDYVVDAHAKDMARIPFGKVWKLLAQLERTYPLVSTERFPGRLETISVYRFRLRAPRSAKP
jgi:hypothetical protein